MSFLNAADLAESRSFKTRVLMAVVNAAAAVVHEDTSGMSENRSEKRAVLARNVLNDPHRYAALFVWPVIANTTIAANGLDSPDGDLFFAVASNFDAMAGVTPQDMIKP